MICHFARGAEPRHQIPDLCETRLGFGRDEEG